MREIEIRRIDREHAADINIKNEPFRLFGRMLPCYCDGRWSYSTERFPAEKEEWDIFPDENYVFDQMNGEYAFLGAYDGPDCIGLAILQNQWNRYMYLHDLKVNGPYRRGHVATRLLQAACMLAKERGYRGVWTIGQDNNLAACLFYVHTGFRIGGVDTEVYTGTRQAGKRDIHFYREAE